MKYEHFISTITVPDVNENWEDKADTEHQRAAGPEKPNMSPAPCQLTRKIRRDNQSLLR